jgi:hypothetical protein
VAHRSIAIPLFLLFALAGATSAPAAEAPTREEYVQALEKTCKPDALATQRTMKGARADVRAERVAVAARKFAKASAIFSGTLKRISVEPRPSADVDRLERWFTYLNRQESYLRQITEQLRLDHLVKAQRLIPRFIHNGNQANYVVLAFGFDWCSFKFSRYG